MSKWDNLAAWWAKGTPVAVIAQRVGVSRQAVWHAAHRRGLRRPVKTWDTVNTAILLLLWGDGVSTREIAERIGTTRGAVIGKADRMGLPTHPLISGGRR
jgi:hypothetical protein